MVDTYKTISCPQCDSVMKKIFIPTVGLSVDICADSCGAIFFDNQEMQKITNSNANTSEIREILDKGDFKTLPKREVIVCPACGQRMQKTILQGFNIEIDTCYGCGGIFLDNGEYDIIRQCVRTQDIEKLKSLNSNSTITDDMISDLYKEAQAEDFRLKTIHQVASAFSRGSRRHFGYRCSSGLLDILWTIFS